MRSALTIRDLPVSERPRERLIRLGAEALSEQELLACVLGRGVAGESVLVSARRVLAAFGTLRGLAEASVEQLAGLHGIGPAKAAQLKASVELARRLACATNGRRAVIDSVEAAAAVVRPHLLDKQKEHVVALLLDNRRRLIRLSPIAVGSLSASLVHPRELFKEAIAASAAAVIVAHNHPSGDPEPSEHDVQLTRRLCEAGELLGIEVLDHLILGSSGVVSLRAAGAMGGATKRPATGRPSTMRLRLALAIGAALAWGQGPATAAATMDRLNEARPRSHPACAKLGRGVANTLGGWLELPLTIHTQWSPRDTGSSLFSGAAHGLFKGLVRMGVGVYEAVTFFLPFPNGFAPILPPLEYFDAATRKTLPLE